MKYEAITKRKNGLIRYKFVCPKVKWIKGTNGKYKRKCYCENPCTSSSFERMFYIYPEKYLCAYPVFYVVLLNWMKIIKYVQQLRNVSVISK